LPRAGEIIGSLIYLLFTPLRKCILRTGAPEPHIKLSGLKIGVGHRGIKMKKIIVFVAFMCTLAVLVGRPSADVPRLAALETLPLLATMQSSTWLPTEAYDAI
jgi:hypothetical protein